MHSMYHHLYQHAEKAKWGTTWLGPAVLTLMSMGWTLVSFSFLCGEGDLLRCLGCLRHLGFALRAFILATLVLVRYPLTCACATIKFRSCRNSLFDSFEATGIRSACWKTRKQEPDRHEGHKE